MIYFYISPVILLVIFLGHPAHHMCVKAYEKVFLAMENPSTMGKSEY